MCVCIYVSMCVVHFVLPVGRWRIAAAADVTTADSSHLRCALSLFALTLRAITRPTSRCFMLDAPSCTAVPARNGDPNQHQNQTCMAAVAANRAYHPCRH